MQIIVISIIINPPEVKDNLLRGLNKTRKPANRDFLICRLPIQPNLKNHSPILIFIREPY